MSSTGRTPRQGSLAGLQRVRHPDDYYRTPSWTVEALLDRVADLDGVGLEPGCGDGAILETLRQRQLGPVVGIEANTERAVDAALAIGTGIVLHTDFLEMGSTDIQVAAPAYPAPSWAVSNPPFKLAEAFVRHTLDLLQPGGRAFFLLRIAFLAGQKRAKAGLWNHLASVYVLPRRPSFTGRGTDSADYAWMEWRVGWSGSATLEHLKL